MEDFKASDKNTSDSSHKLCMDVLAQRWADRSGGSALDYENAVRKELNAPNATHDELNKMFEAEVKRKEIRNNGGKGEEIYDSAIKALDCE